MKKTVFIKNAVILTLSSLVLRFAGIIFKVKIADIMGSEGIGLYQLIFSFYILASTFATSGISTAVTRLVSEELALGSKKGTIKILCRSIEITLCLALISLAAVFFGAEFIAKSIIGDIRAVNSLKILPFALPFMGVSSCIKGYFIAVRRVTPNATTQIFEQAARIILILFLIKKYLSRGLSAACAAVLAGDSIAEILACSLVFIFFLRDTKKLNILRGRKLPNYGITRKIARIALPITSGRYLNTALRTAENILVPKNLAKFSLSGGAALSQFGMIKGMALPILLFPSTLLNSISLLLIPEMSEERAKKRWLVVKYSTRKILKWSVLLAYIFGAFFLFSGERIGILIYHSKEVGLLLKALSPIVPFMYLDSISDGILKGLDQQNFTFKTAVCDSVLRIIFILILLPLTGIRGFIIIMYFSNFFTCFLNVRRLKKVTDAALDFKGEILLPSFLALTVTFLVNKILCLLKISNNLIFLSLLVGVSLAVYITFIFILKIMQKEEITHIFKG